MKEEELREREIEILELAAQGLTNKEIAEKLTLSVKTIENYLHYLYGKLGVNNRTEATALCLTNGLINLDDTDTDSSRDDT